MRREFVPSGHCDWVTSHTHAFAVLHDCPELLHGRRPLPRRREQAGVTEPDLQRLPMRQTNLVSEASRRLPGERYGRREIPSPPVMPGEIGDRA